MSVSARSEWFLALRRRSQFRVGLGIDKDDPEDDIDCTAGDVNASLSTWMDERSKTNAARAQRGEVPVPCLVGHVLTWKSRHDLRG